MTDVREMPCHALADIYFGEVRAVSRSKSAGITVCPARCAEAGHCYRADALSVKSEHIGGVNGDDQRKRRIQPARKPQYGIFAADVPIAIRENNRTNLSDKISHYCVKLP